MLIALALPQVETVDLMFAFDLANLIGHLATTFPQVNVRIIAVPQAENGDLMDKSEIARLASAEGANLVTFLGDRRFAPELLDQMLVAAIPEFIEAEAHKLANASLSNGVLH